MKPNERPPKKWKMMEKEGICSFMISSSRHLFTPFPLRNFSRFWVSFCIDQEMDKGDINAVSLADLEDALQQNKSPGLKLRFVDDRPTCSFPKMPPFPFHQGDPSWTHKNLQIVLSSNLPDWRDKNNAKQYGTFWVMELTWPTWP